MSDPHEIHDNDAQRRPCACGCKHTVTQEMVQDGGGYIDAMGDWWREECYDEYLRSCEAERRIRLARERQ